MNPLRAALLGLTLTLSVTRTDAAFKSARFVDDNPLPVYPPVLTMEGITRGSVVVALSIDASGRVADSLVLGYTNDLLLKSTKEVLAQWRFEPAELDGQPVSVQTELRLDFTVRGAVISSNLLNHFFFDNFDQLGDNAWCYEPVRANRLDGRPVLVSGAQPSYAEQAAKDGVRGRVQVRFYINERGEVRLPAVTSPTHPYLAERAVEAVRSWKFQPPTTHGRPALVVAQQTFEFGDKP